MKQWEYTIAVEVKNIKLFQQETVINAWGQKGWELTAVVYRGEWIKYYFKREIPNLTNQLE